MTPLTCPSSSVIDSSNHRLVSQSLRLQLSRDTCCSCSPSEQRIRCDFDWGACIACRKHARQASLVEWWGRFEVTLRRQLQPQLLCTGSIELAFRFVPQKAFDGLAAVGEVQGDLGSVRAFLQTRDGARVDFDLRVGTQGAGEGVGGGFGAIGVDGDAVEG